VQITHHPHKHKCAIEQTLAAFLKSVGAEIDDCSGDVFVYILAKDSPAADLTVRQTVRVTGKDILLISLTDLAHELTEALR
jgi:hypothetical protein